MVDNGENINFLTSQRYPKLKDINGNINNVFEPKLINEGKFNGRNIQKIPRNDGIYSSYIRTQDTIKPGVAYTPISKGSIKAGVLDAQTSKD